MVTTEDFYTIRSQTRSKWEEYASGKGASYLIKQLYCPFLQGFVSDLRPIEEIRRLFVIIREHPNVNDAPSIELSASRAVLAYEKLSGELVTGVPVKSLISSAQRRDHWKFIGPSTNAWLPEIEDSGYVLDVVIDLHGLKQPLRFMSSNLLNTCGIFDSKAKEYAAIAAWNLSNVMSRYVYILGAEFGKMFSRESIPHEPFLRELLDAVREVG